MKSMLQEEQETTDSSLLPANKRSLEPDAHDKATWDVSDMWSILMQSKRLAGPFALAET